MEIIKLKDEFDFVNGPVTYMDRKLKTIAISRGEDFAAAQRLLERLREYGASEEVKQKLFDVCDALHISCLYM